MWPYASLAAAGLLAGKMDDAKSALGRVRRLDPQVTMKSLIPLAPPIPNLFDSLRKAGMPEERARPASLHRSRSPMTSATAGSPVRTRTAPFRAYGA